MGSRAGVRARVSARVGVRARAMVRAGSDEPQKDKVEASSVAGLLEKWGEAGARAPEEGKARLCAYQRRVRARVRGTLALALAL